MTRTHISMRGKPTNDIRMPGDRPKKAGTFGGLSYACKMARAPEHYLHGQCYKLDCECKCHGGESESTNAK